jgi:hypothetical protein
MDLVTDVYNKLHSRDDLVFCISCGRILYIPEDLPPETAINSRGKADKEPSASRPRASRTRMVEKLDPSERRPKGKIGQLLAGAQGESVKTAVDAGMPPVECEVFIDGKMMGTYKGRTREHLERVIQVRMGEAKLNGNVEVKEKNSPDSASPETGSAEQIEPTEPNPETVWSDQTQ